MRRAGAIIRRTLRSFYDDQMTHHAAALTYYALMSLFPAVLLALSLLGLLGQYPETYNAIMGYLAEAAPASVVDPLDRSLRDALQSKGTAATALVISVAVALYGTTGALEAARRALNVVFDVDGGRSFVRRKAIDVASTFVLMALVLASLLLAFVGGRFAEDLLGFIGLGSTAARAWNVARWPGAVAIAMLVFAFIYYVTPDVQQRSFRWLTPGAAVGVLLWLLASFGLSTYVSKVVDVGAVYGTFAGAILLVAWLWLTNVALLLGAELNAEIERERELRDGVPAGRLSIGPPGAASVTPTRVSGEVPGPRLGVVAPRRPRKRAGNRGAALAVRAPAVHRALYSSSPLAAIARLFPKLVEPPGLLLGHCRPRRPPGDDRAARSSRRRRTCSSSRARLPSAFSTRAEFFLIRAIRLIAPVEPCKPCFAGSDLVHGGPQLGVGRQLTARSARGVVLTDLPVTLPACQLEPRDSNATAPVLIVHSYLIPGLSHGKARARKRDQRAERTPKLRPSLVLYREAHGAGRAKSSGAP